MAVAGMAVAAILEGASACSIPYADVMKSFEAAAPCCSSMAGFLYRPLSYGQELKIELNASSPAYFFPSGKSYFAAFALPIFEGPYRVTVESFMVGEELDRAYLFSPHLIILDDGHRIVRTIGHDLFTLRKAGMTETWGYPYKLAGTFDVREENRDERYLVVMTTDELLHARTSLTTMKVVPIIIPGIVTAVPAGTEEKLIRHAPVGTLVIKLERIAP
jgi:maltose operon protein